MNKVRYGIIGFGGFAERTILPAINKSETSELVAIQKRDINIAREKAKQYAIPLAFSRVEELVSSAEIDAVFIGSSNHAHCRETLLAAASGKHVLVEKPMAMNTAEAHRMIEACQKNNVRLMVGHMVRYSPLVQRIKHLIKDGEIGDVIYTRSEFFYDARLSKRTWLMDRTIAGGGPVFDIGVHCLDTVRYILGADIIGVQAVLQPVPTSKETEKTSLVSLKFSSGVVGSIFVSFAAGFRRSVLEFIGSDGMISSENFTLANTTSTLSIFKGNDPATTRHEKIVVPDLYLREINEFSACIINDTPSSISEEEGLINQRIIDEVMISGR
jgi:1,5-anhydro-D-fructose reductase (1,5-anhydro-D-mannitol-forming)